MAASTPPDAKKPIFLKPENPEANSVVERFVMRYEKWRHDRTWEYGICGDNDRPARRHRKKGIVQFVLWKAGERGHDVDCWHDFDRSWWVTFKANA